MTDYSYAYAETLVHVDNVNVHYTSPILRDLSLEIKNVTRPGMTQGQVVGLLAPSGMGKTQLFRCIAGLKVPDSGGVFLNGSATSVKAGEVGVVAQNYPLFAHLTVMTNMMLAARRKIKDPAQAKEAIAQLLDRFGLGDRINNYPHELSGGQQQRVAILQQVVCSGHLLLMDEPFSGLDPIMKEHVQGLISQLAAADELNSIILTTHDIESAVATCDTILLLGRDKDAQGNLIPGARVQHSYDLMQMGLAWHPQIESLPAFHELTTEIRSRFKEL